MIAQGFSRIAVGEEPELVLRIDVEQALGDDEREGRVGRGVAAAGCIGVEKPDRQADRFQPRCFSGRPKIDQAAARCEQRVRAVQGMDHALDDHSSQAPREDDRVERSHRQVEVFVQQPRGATGHVRPRAVGVHGRDASRIRIDGQD